MATLTSVLPSLIAMGSKALRDRLVLARYCNKDASLSPIPLGGSISVAIPSAITAVEVTADRYPPTTTAIAPTAVAVTCSNWWEAPFELSDKDLAQVDRGIIPMQASEAIKALANKIESTLWTAAKAVYGYAGTAGTTPFATDLSGFTAADKVLNDQLCPADNRHFVMNTAARANALNLTSVVNASFRGSAEAITRGEMGTILGAEWHYSTLVPTQTTAATHYWVNDGGDALAVGDKTVAVETDGGATGYFRVGDIITFAGDTQTYAVTSVTGGTGTSSSINISPGLVLDPGNHAAITVKASHVMNLLFHRDLLAFASGLLQDTALAPNLVEMTSLVDPESQIALRLELTREHKRWRFSYDALWGVAVPRPELGCRLAG